MNNTKHTPGPLHIRKAIRNGDYAVLTSSGDIVAECYEAIRRHDEKATDEAKSNATLYAAAPELLEALDKLTQRILDDNSPLCVVPEFEAARAAIAKVRP